MSIPIRVSVLFGVLLLTTTASAKRPFDWALQLCRMEPNKYECRKITNRNGPFVTWKSLFSDPTKRQLIIAINRRNSLLWHNHWIALPKEPVLNYLDYAPFEEKIFVTDKTVVLVDLNVLAWAAYRNGELINWGPANGGMKRCKETGLMKCITYPGEYKVLQKAGAFKRSDLYKEECTDKKVCRGVLMPYYMKIKDDGMGLHGAKTLPGWNASHGCVRLLVSDARWLNKNFVDFETKVIIKPY